MDANKEFYRGMTAAIAVLSGHGADTFIEEILDTVDADELIAQARRDGAMRWSGLSKIVAHRKEAKDDS